MPHLSLASTSEMLMEIHLPVFFLQGSHWSHGPCSSQPLALKHQRTREKCSKSGKKKKKEKGIEKVTAGHCYRVSIRPDFHKAKTEVDAAVLL